MTTPSRLVPLLEQFDFGCQRLTRRMTGPVMDSGNGTSVEVSPTTDQDGLSTYPHGSDPDDPFIDIVWWVNQEVLHHGAEIALLRDLYRARAR